MFEALIPQIAITLDECYNKKREDDVKEIIESLIDVAEAEPTIYKRYFAQLYASMITYSSNKQFDDSTRHMMIDLLISIIERVTSLASKEVL